MLCPGTEPYRGLRGQRNGTVNDRFFHSSRDTGGMILALCFISLVVLSRNRRTKKYREPDISLPPYHGIHLQHRDTHRTERWLR